VVLLDAVYHRRVALVKAAESSVLGRMVYPDGEGRGKAAVMSVVIYPRLGEVLEEKHVTVRELRRRIKERFGLNVSPRTLYGLALDEPVGRTDLKVIGAAAAALDVTLNDLLVVETSPNGSDVEGDRPILGPQENQRLAELFDRQEQSILSEPEKAELRALVDLYGRRLHERRLRELADERGVPVEQVRRDVDAELDDARAWWAAFESDPANRQAVIDRVERRRGDFTE